MSSSFSICHHDCRNSKQSVAPKLGLEPSKFILRRCDFYGSPGNPFADELKTFETEGVTDGDVVYYQEGSSQLDNKIEISVIIHRPVVPAEPETMIKLPESPTEMFTVLVQSNANLLELKKACIEQIPELASVVCTLIIHEFPPHVPSVGSPPPSTFVFEMCRIVIAA